VQDADLQYDILRRLGAPDADPSPLAAEDCRLALSALLVRLARRDESYTDAERMMIERVLAERYGLGGADAGALRAEAEALEAEAADTVQFTRLIKAAVPYDERTRVVEALWRVAWSTGSTPRSRASCGWWRASSASPTSTAASPASGRSAPTDAQKPAADAQKPRLMLRVMRTRPPNWLRDPKSTIGESAASSIR
jgi:uncharacterized tellurite resistance protein B-like protein